MTRQNDNNFRAALPLSESQLPRRNRNAQRFIRSDLDAQLPVWRAYEKDVHNAGLQGIGRPSCIHMGATDKETHLTCSKILESQRPRSAYFPASFSYTNGKTLSDLNQVLGGAALPSVGLVTAFLVVRSKLEWARMFR